MSFWPEDINSEEALTPAEILTQVGIELEERNSRLAYKLRSSELEDRFVLTFEVINRLSNRSYDLLKVSHAKEDAYPVRIVPPKNETPEFLEKKKWVSGSPNPFTLHSNLAKAVLGTGFEERPGYWVEDKWVCASPSEFRSQLQELLSENFVISKIIALLRTDPDVQASKPDAPNHTTEETESDSD